MRKLSRGAMAAIAAAIAIPATVVIAKTVEHNRWHNMTPETRARMDEGRLAMAKAALKLTPEQDKLWSPLEVLIRDTFKARDAKRADWEKSKTQREADRTAGKRPDMAERFEKMSQTMTERADRMKAFAGSFKPFYASLSDEQKDVLRPLMRGLAPGDGKGGHHGPRFAEGWGERGGHHGGHQGGWFGRHNGGPEGRERPMMDDGGPEQGGEPRSNDATPAAPPADAK